MGKNYKIRFEEEAYEQILDALEFVSRVSAQAAERLSEEIIEQTKKLESFPNRFPVDKDYCVHNQEERKLTFQKGRYYILFVVEGDEVCIEYFADNRKKKW